MGTPPLKVFYPLAAALLVGVYLVAKWTDGIATGVGFFLLTAAFMAVWIPLSRRSG